MFDVSSTGFVYSREAEFSFMQVSKGGGLAAQKPRLERPDDVQISNLASVSRKLKSVDPDMYNDFIMVMELLKKIDPKLAKHFVDAIDASLPDNSSQGGNPSGVEQAPQTEDLSQGAAQTRAMAFEFSFTLEGTSVEEGQAQQFRISFSMSGVVVEQVQQNQQGDPLVLDLDGNGFNTTGAAKGAAFDLNNDGVKENVSMPVGDGLLVYDRNGNGVIDSGAELFGDQDGDKDGYDALNRYDANADGWIDSRDTIYDKLRVMSYKAGAADFSTASMLTLKDAGIDAISVKPLQTVTTGLNNGDAIAASSIYKKADGTSGATADLLLSYSVA